MYLHTTMRFRHYQSIGQTDGVEDNFSPPGSDLDHLGEEASNSHHSPFSNPSTERSKLIAAMLFVALSMSLLSLLNDQNDGMTLSPTNQQQKLFFWPGSSSSSHPSPLRVPVTAPRQFKFPSGVNFGSWLSLEDYFFAGQAAVEVATPNDKMVGQCLPPLHTGTNANMPKWQSETDLLASLTKESSLAQAIRIFHAHRISYIDWEEDLATLSDLGIRHVRVPLSWCLTDSDPETIDPKDSKNLDEKDLQKQFTCQDPFYQDENDGSLVYWPAIPKQLIQDFLRACARYNIGATLDIHTYPGATSIGTFSGLWPRGAHFWKFDRPEAPDLDVGRRILRDFVTWIESLATNDPEAFRGLRAISPMNEPAHLAGMFSPDDPNAYLPSLPTPLAAEYYQRIQPAASHHHDVGTPIPDGPHLRVLLWLSDAIDTFRQSTLPGLGKELHVNVHESVFSPSVLPYGDGVDYGGRHPGATRIIASWWRSATSNHERQSWAILDMHHYHAWEPACMGTSDGPPSGNYTCGNTASRADALRRCSSWATEAFRKAIDEECGVGAKLASAEFSASTHHRVNRACNDIGTLRASYEAQIDAAEDANVELFWWSYKMPYGGAFRPAWSFKHFLYLMGVIKQPDQSNYICGEHKPTEDEPTDDVFIS